MDYIHSPDRITKPLIRKSGVAKDLNLIDGHTDWREVFREATWQEALDLAAQPLNTLRTWLRRGLLSLKTCMEG